MADVKRTSNDIDVTNNSTTVAAPSTSAALESTYDEKNSIHGVEDPSRPFPTEEEWATLPKVAGRIPWQAWTVAVCEFAERFSYYGTTAVFVNFIQKKLPPGSKTGAGFLRKPGSGALGMGQRASTGLTTFNAFWSYITPLGGAYIADQYLGRYATIQWAIMFAMIGHVILIISAIPPVIVKGSSALACFTIGLVIMGIGTGGFKSNISPLIAEQYLETRAYVRTNKKGKKEIVDPATTSARIYLYFYLLINCGSLCGSLAMVYAEHYVGFYLSFLLPTLVFSISPLVLFIFKKHYHLTPPTGSVMGKAFKLIKFAFKGKWSFNPMTLKRNLKDDNFWNRVKPSNIPREQRPEWMTFDDLWVDEVRRGLLACKVFLWYPLYWLAYNQMTNNLTSQANTLKLGGVPNDVLNNLNPISIIILVPIMDFIIYPAIRKTGFDFTPIKKITGGFMLASFSMVAATVTQAWIYKNGPCGNQPNYRAAELEENCEANLSVWIQTLPYVLIGFSEVLASITKLEYAYTKAPKNMRSTVQAIALSTSAISSALSQALVALSEDPLLVWNYGSVAVVAFAGGVGFYFTFRKADKQEHQLNAMQASAYEGRHVADVESRTSSNIDVTGAAVIPTEKI